MYGLGITGLLLSVFGGILWMLFRLPIGEIGAFIGIGLMCLYIYLSDKDKKNNQAVKYYYSYK